MSNKNITDEEIAIIKRLISNKETGDNITFKINLYRYYFDKKPLNSGRINEIKNNTEELGERAKNIVPADEIIFENFNNIIQNGNIKTRLNPHIKEHESIIKAREFMILAIASFNNQSLTSINLGTESYLLLSNIAYTALFQAIAQKNNIPIIDSKHNNKHLSLSILIQKIANNPQTSHILSKHIIKNLEFLIGIRNQITHSPISKIPPQIFMYLQADCCNFNSIINKEFGYNMGLDNVFGIALQLAKFEPFQFKATSKNKNNHLNIIEQYINNFESKLDEETLNSNQYKCNISIIPTLIKNKNQADYIVSLVNPNTQDQQELNTLANNIVIKEKKILLDKTENYPYTYTQVINKLKEDCYTINAYILNKINKQYNIQSQDSYAYKIPIIKQKQYLYSQVFIDFLKNKLQQKNLN